MNSIRERGVLSAGALILAVFVFACGIGGHETSRVSASGGTVVEKANIRHDKKPIQKRPDWLPPHVSLNVPGGVYIPIMEAHNITFVKLSYEPLTLIAAEVADNSDSNQVVILKTVGPVHLDNGMVLGEECSEHLRIGDTIIGGVAQNSSTDAVVRVWLSDGTFSDLRPGEGLFVGKKGADGSSENSSMSTHHFECECTCTSESGTTAVVSWTCTICEPTGDHCKGSDGGACRADPPGQQPEFEGTLSGCREILVPDPSVGE